MAREKQGTSNKHSDFVALLRSSMYVPEKKVSPAAVAEDTDAENEVDLDFLRELEKQFDELFGPVD